MTPIPGEPLQPQAPELTMGDGRKVKLKLPGLAPPVKPHGTEQRGGVEPPRSDPRPPIDPNVIGPPA
jgi:hypothetical protein